MVSFESIVVVVCAIAVIAIGVWWFYRAACITKENLNDELPYKVETPKAAPDLAVSTKGEPTKWVWAFTEAPKRKYTKRSKYWSGTKVKTKMSNARKARKSK